MALLDIFNLTKNFNGLVAVDNVNFSVGERTITAIIGPNGAGKTTVFNMISGLGKPTSGSIIFGGLELTKVKEYKLCGMGIGRVFQIPKIFGELSVLENVMVGLHAQTRSDLVKTGLHLPSMVREENMIREWALKKLKMFNLLESKEKLAGTLPFGNQRLLEIARALATEPKLLLLDEPTAGLTPAETEVLKNRILTIRDSGTTILIVEHNLSMVFSISDHVIVLNYGKKIFEGPPSLVRRNPEVIDAYIGRRGLK